MKKVGEGSGNECLIAIENELHFIEQKP